MQARDIEVVTTLRGKNQITVPDQIVRELGLKQGDRLVFRLRLGGRAEIVQLRPLRKSYAGTMREVFGSDEEALAYVREERAAWGDDDD